MRNARTITALVAAFTAVVLGFGHVAADAATLPQHNIINFAAGEGTPNHFYIKGNVTTAKGHKVFLQRKSGTSWVTKKYDVAAASSGFFRINFTGPVGSCWRILVKATKFRRTTTRRAGCIVSG
jgi:hypothetical protein